MFSYLSPEQRVPAAHPLRAIRKMCDEILGQVSELFERMDSQLGRPSIPPEKTGPSPVIAGAVYRAY